MERAVPHFSAPALARSLAPLGYALVLYVVLAIGSFGLGGVDPPRLALMSICLLFALWVVLTRPLEVDRWDVFVLGGISVWMILAATRGIYTDLWLPKFDGAVLGGALAFVIARGACVRYRSAFDDYFITAALLVLLMTLAYKLHFGFGDRTVRYFLNGPIVFGWMMGIGCILSFLAWLRSDRPVYALIAMVFLLAIVWSASKGPVIALVPALLACALVSGRWSRLALAGIAFYAAWYFAAQFDVLPERFEAFARVLDGTQAAQDKGSIELRQFMWDYSWTTFKDSPVLGVGLGNWSLGMGGSYFVANGMIYPHNLVFELLSEHGVIGTFVLLAAILAAFIRCDKAGRCVMIFVFVGLQFTGDMAYWPFLIAFPLALRGRQETA